MNATRNQLETASNIISRNRERINSNETVKEEEINALFYWIMGKMMNNVENCRPAMDYHEVEITVSTGFYIKTVIVQDIASKHFEPFHVDTCLSEEEFYEVMRELSEIINSIPYFSAYFNENVDPKNLKVILNMTE